MNGLHCILITDRDGVPLVTASTDKAPPQALKPSFISTFGMATDQASKLGLGRNKTIISMYSSYQVSISFQLEYSLTLLSWLCSLIFFFLGCHSCPQVGICCYYSIATSSRYLLTPILANFIQYTMPIILFLISIYLHCMIV